MDKFGIHEAEKYTLPSFVGSHMQKVWVCDSVTGRE